MKHLKMIGAATAAAALMAAVGVGTAAGTTLDCSSSGTMCVAPTKVHLVNEGNITFDEAISLTCEEMTIEAELSTGSEVETPSGAVTAFSFQKCGGWTMNVIRKGSLEIHTRTSGVNDGNGTLTSKEMEFTQEGFGLHCIYGTGTGHDIGTVTGSKNTGGNAVFHIEAEITRLGGRSGAFCGGTNAKWTGKFRITTPSYLDVT